MKLRLLFVITTSDFGGSESFLLRLVSSLDRDAFELEVCSLCPPGRVARQLEALNIPVTSLNMDAKARPLPMIAAAFHLRRLFRTAFDGRGAQVVQSLLYRANVLCALARRLGWGPQPRLVTGQRSLIPKGRSLDFKAQRLTRTWADKVVAVSDAVKRELLATEPIDEQDVVVIQNGIDLDHFDLPEAAERAAARSALPLPKPPSSADPPLVVGAVGRLHGPKGIDVLLRAFPLVIEAIGRPCVLVLAGDGPDAERLKALAAELLPPSQVLFLGFQQDPRPLFPAFDVYVLPSMREGSPNALLEAMGTGRACVASAVGGVPEAIVDGEHGLLVPAGDPRALADALIRLLDDPELRARFGQAARRRVEARFRVEDMVTRHAELYQGLLGL